MVNIKMKSPDFINNPEENFKRFKVEPEHTIYNKLHELYKAKEKLTIEQLEIIDGKVPSVDDMVKHGRVDMYQKERLLGITREYMSWKGKLTIIFETVFTEGKFHLKTWKAHKDDPTTDS